MATPPITRDEIEAAEPLNFTRPAARLPEAETRGPTIQWATGLPTTDRRIYAGWFIEVGQDEALDDAAFSAGLPRVDIRHGAGNVVEHYALEQAALFLLADSVQPMRASQRDGIAFGWSTHPATGRAQSHLRCKVMPRVLMAAGYLEPLTLTVKGTLTGDLLTAFTRQYDVLDAARNKKGDLPLYAFSLPLGPGDAVLRGKDATKEIVPPVALVPTPISEAYMRSQWIGHRDWLAAIEEQMDGVIAWADAESARIAQGEDGQG